MFALERIKIIKRFLVENSQVEVSKLSETLGVSEVTIRRDLEKLEKEGFLTRTHGGAIRNLEAAVLCREEEPEENEKCREISEIASNMVHDNDVIMFTNGPINRAIASRLGDRQNLTVLTNDVELALELSEFSNMKVSLLGGDLDSSSKAVYGKLAESNLSKFFVNKVFIEVDGVNRSMGYSVSSTEKASLIQQAISNSNSAIFVFTTDVVDKTAFFHVGEISIADRIVTNNNISDEYKHFIFENEVQLFTSINMYEG